MKNSNLTWLSVLTGLKDQGVAAVVISYAGSGDSGAIEHIGYFSEKNVTRNEQNLPDASEVNTWEHETDLEPDLTSDTIRFIEDNAYTVLNTLEDWWNNEGGEGVLMIDTTTANYTCNNGVNHMNTEYHNHSGKFTS